MMKQIPPASHRSEKKIEKGREATQHDVPGTQRNKKKCEASRETEEKNKKKKARKDEGKRQSEKEKERRKRRAQKRARKRSRSTEICAFSEEKDEKEVKTRRKLKAEPVSLESISETDL